MADGERPRLEKQSPSAAGTVNVALVVVLADPNSMRPLMDDSDLLSLDTCGLPAGNLVGVSDRMPEFMACFGSGDAERGMELTVRTSPIAELKSVY